jgi:hypothetical protein
MGWLHQEKQFGWMKAEFYRDMVNRYLLEVIPRGKRPKQPFVFSRKLLDDTISQMARVMFSLEVTRTFGTLNAIYWFVEYLSQRQAISESMCLRVQAWCELLWRVAIPQFLESTIEARAFNTFPQ